MARRASKPPAFQWGDQLILFRYFLNLFGKDTLAGLGGRLNDAEYEGVNENQNTFFWRELDGVVERQQARAKISCDALREYDGHICRYVKQIGENRGGIRLKYFQYIACLFTEMYLDRYFTDKGAFAAELNCFLENVKKGSPGGIDIEPFTPANMNKLAFMCATGSGKTLIMHINILQFGHYLKKARRYNPHMEINKIIVLAPNEGMSNQHLAELYLSRISAEPFVKSGFGNTADVIVIDMNKLKEEGKVKTVSVDSFEQDNLVLVDEAHRGLAGDVWYDYRSRLSAEGGFAFEYSATLKQAMKTLDIKKNKALLDEYFRSIIIDYSYKFFYEDGYGKEYRIYNLRESYDDEQQRLYLTGCLLSFYQQLKLFAERGKDYASFMLEKPLLVFVGNRVTAKTSAAEMTDVEEVLDFIDKFVNNRELTINRINAVMNENTGLMDSRGRELFSQNFNALYSLFGHAPKAEDVYKDIMRVVFNSNTLSDGPRLRVLNLRQAQGEIALSVGADGEYFGVISIGDTPGLIKNCEANGIVTGTDEFASESLFRSINDKGSNIKILIGSRKFTEGWNSWRVSTMGLINFAKGEGSQAIQLFGRGVRLRGHGGCLKRSGKLDDRSVTVPENIEMLETLTIFGVKAQYMEDFKRHLEMEDMPADENPREYTLPVISRYNEVKNKRLRVIKVKDGANFKKQAARLLLGAPDEGFARYLSKNKLLIDCRSRVQTLESASGTQLESATEEQTLDSQFIPFLDYERVFDELETYKNEKLYYNISLQKDSLAAILRADGWYSLIIPKARLDFYSMEKLSMYSDFAVMALKSYIDKFYKYEKDRWETPLLEYQELDESDSNFVDYYKFSCCDGYEGDPYADTVKNFVNDLRTLLNQKNGIPTYQTSALNGSLIAFDFRQHLYTPLIFLKAGGLKLTVSPISLNEDEKYLVDKLKFYVDGNKDALNGKSLYLLRNKSKAGMGFFEAGNFYPDFVLWIDTPETQYVSFMDPKGLRHMRWDDPKIEFYATIKALEARLQPSSADKRIALNSFIISSTRSEELRQWWGKDKLERHAKNVFCLDESDCVEKMMEKILSLTL
ncbi:MAG: DEAD/DEAH box helicase family protein [Holophagales bacterium]|jgi:superfamily II DNA or RNA helicase|nr:DEAD/DEAH box helicase family protein [Holophagales bacterium]